MELIISFTLTIQYAGSAATTMAGFLPSVHLYIVYNYGQEDCMAVQVSKLNLPIKRSKEMNQVKSQMISFIPDIFNSD